MFVGVVGGKQACMALRFQRNKQNAGVLKQIQIGRPFSKQETGFVGWGGERADELGFRYIVQWANWKSLESL